MLELFGDLETALIEVAKQDRFFDKISENDMDLLMKFARDNADKAYLYVNNQGFNLEFMRDFIGDYCKITYDDRKDILAYSDIRFPMNVITIYLYHINQMIETYNLKNHNKERIIDCFIIHEFYHYLEHYIDLNLNEFLIDVLKVGIFRKTMNFMGLSEMSAMIFMRMMIQDIEQYTCGGNDL